jgi:hypothetical protein
MEKIMITMALLLTLTMGVQAAGQKHRHTPQEELVDSTQKDAIEAFSDTTSTAATPVADDATAADDNDDVESVVLNAFSDVRGKDLAGIILILGVLLIIFVLAPVLIIIALFYFISKNRKEKMRLAQMAMQQGQPIPDQLLKDSPADVDDEYQKGMRQCFVGVGLMIFLGYAAGQVGFGIGALVFCIGLGKVFASRTARRNKETDLYKDQFDNKDNQF